MRNVWKLEGTGQSVMSPGTVSPHAEVIAQAPDGTPLVVIIDKPERRIATLNFLPIPKQFHHSGFQDGDFGQVVANALMWVSRITMTE